MVPAPNAHMSILPTSLPTHLHAQIHTNSCTNSGDDAIPPIAGGLSEKGVKNEVQKVAIRSEAVKWSKTGSTPRKENLVSVAHILDVVSNIQSSDVLHINLKPFMIHTLVDSCHAFVVFNLQCTAEQLRNSFNVIDVDKNSYIGTNTNIHNPNIILLALNYFSCTRSTMLAN